jgi:hypothetical protein
MPRRPLATPADADDGAPPVYQFGALFPSMMQPPTVVSTL